ncbi:MAG TPA: hypothetical protein DCS35_18800 [Vibrio sp.]|nr:hypothetical protein [Vibrio sp.]
MVLSELPLVVTLYVVMRLANHSYKHGVLAPSLLGEVTFYPDGRVVLQEGKVMRCQQAVLILPELGLLLKLDQNWYLLWRDSVNAQVYWQLMLQLKKEP